MLDALAPVLDAVGRVHGSADLGADLQAVLEGIVEAVGFSAGAINYVRSDGSMEIVAVVGPPEARETLIGVEIPAGLLEEELAVAQRWGRLRFLPAGTVATEVPYAWIPDLPAPTTPDGWHPEDALLAPLHDGPDQLIGILSVDMPLSGLRPDALQLRLLELLAGQAETALRNARRAQRLRASEESFRLAFESTAVGMGLIGMDPREPLRLLTTNRALEQIMAATGDDPVAVLSDLLDPDDPDHEPQRWISTIGSAPGGVHRAEKQLRGDGERPWVHITATVLPLHTTEEGRAIVMVEGITERRRAQRDLQLQATSDALTGLANRSGLSGCVAAAAAAARDGAPGSLLFCDLDDFTSINDVFGHLAGDAVLRACARRLVAAIRRGDQVFRLGGDESAVVVRDLTASEIDTFVARIRSRVAAPIDHGGRRLGIGISVGCAVIDGSTVTVDELLAAADAAMYRDKRGKPARTRRRHTVDTNA